MLSTLTHLFTIDSVGNVRLYILVKALKAINPEHLELIHIVGEPLGESWGYDTPPDHPLCHYRYYDINQYSTYSRERCKATKAVLDVIFSNVVLEPESEYTIIDLD